MEVKHTEFGTELFKIMMYVEDFGLQAVTIDQAYSEFHNGSLLEFGLDEEEIPSRETFQRAFDLGIIKLG